MPPRALFGLRPDGPAEWTTASLSLGVQIVDVWKSFQPGLPVIQGASLRMERGDLVVVEGPTGSGKSTLLRLVAGIERPETGRIAVGGVELTGASPAVVAPVRRTMGMLLAGMPLLTRLTIAENVALALRAAQTPLRDRRVRIYEILKVFELEDRRNEYPDRLSAGEAQCVALARALAARPSVVLADEPTALMDRRKAAVAVSALRDAHVRGATVLVTSHDPEVAGRLGARRVQLRGGRLDDAPAARRGVG